jgi:hypothetical protein
VLSGVVLSATPPQQATPRVVAIGDIHGAYDELTGILRSAGLIDERELWSGGTTVLVQTGDILDRGVRVRAVLDLLMRLEGEARRAGGRVEVALGNHEVMNLLLEFRDASPDVFATFADQKSESRRERAYADVVALARRRVPSSAPPDRAAWMESHPPGFIEYTEALAPRGSYGRWLRSRKVAIKEGDTLFMHAGIGPETPGSVDDVNRSVAREIAAYDEGREMLVRAGMIRPFFTLRETIEVVVSELQRISAAVRTKLPLDEYVTTEYVEALQGMVQLDKSPLLAGEGPLWFRGFAQWPPEEEPKVKKVLDRLRVARIVCGHTPIVPGGITPRFGGRVILLDTGMLSSIYKGGRASALEVQGGELTAIYADKREAIAEAVAK